MIAIGCDHGGFVLKQEIIKFLESAGYEYEDFGTYSEESCDYPVYAKKVAHAVADGKCEKGIIICGTGIGVSIVARVIGPGLATEIVKIFLETPFSNDERHIRRISQIED